MYYFFMRLQYYDVNGLIIPDKHRYLYLWTSMICFTALEGVNVTPKRNLVYENISNILLVLRSYVLK